MNKVVYPPKVMHKKDAGREVESERRAQCTSKRPHVEWGGGMEPCSKKTKSNSSVPWPTFEFRSESGWGAPVSVSKPQPQPQLQPQMQPQKSSASPRKQQKEQKNAAMRLSDQVPPELPKMPTQKTQPKHNKDHVQKLVV